MLLWAVDNPAPANYLLISGHRDFSNALHQLNMRRYNILLVHPPQVSPSLLAAAKVVWLWTTLFADGDPLHVTDSDSDSASASYVNSAILALELENGHDGRGRNFCTQRGEARFGDIGGSTGKREIHLRRRSSAFLYSPLGSCLPGLVHSLQPVQWVSLSPLNHLTPICREIVGFWCCFDVQNLTFVCTRILLPPLKLMIMKAEDSKCTVVPRLSLCFNPTLREREQARPILWISSNAGYTVYSFALGHYWKW
ncbi:unnamed protein product [Sphenostylis stenocarpa]|uniref:NYN domain-containing protein n=1 Tax=Sphenostylis stenocarpa TaxID=92480 RepID=A0AA86RWH4_9FABA|nr:unnamed protein product [Sphenostylis stenocarpa]